MEKLIEEFHGKREEWKATYLEDPVKALEIATEALGLADSLQSIIRAQALALHGSALRATGRYIEAERAFIEALDNLDESCIQDRADIYRRVAYLKAEQQEFEQAIQSIDNALELAEGEHHRGTVLLAKGFILNEMKRYGEAIPLFIEAISLIDAKRCGISGAVALHNLIVAVSLEQSVSYDVLKDMLQGLDSARKSLYKKDKLFRVKLQWAEGLVETRFGLNNKAKRSLTIARRGLRRMQVPLMEFAMITVDLAQAYLNLDEHAKCKSLLLEAKQKIERVDGINPVAVKDLSDQIENMDEEACDIDIFRQAKSVFSFDSDKTAQYPAD